MHQHQPVILQNVEEGSGLMMTGDDDDSYAANDDEDVF